MKHEQQHDHYRDVTYVAAIVALLSVAFITILVGHRVIEFIDVAETSVNKIGDTAAALPAHLDSGVTSIQGELAAQAQDISNKLNGQIAGARKDAVQLALVGRSDIQDDFGQLRSDYAQAIAFGLSVIDDHATKVEGLIAPTLDSANGAITEFDIIQHDLRPQLGGLLGASKISAGETAQTLKVIRDAAPQFIASQEKIAENVAEITKDAAIISDKIVKPKTKKEILLEALFPSLLIASHFF
jgi:hypothetical protein